MISPDYRLTIIDSDTIIDSNTISGSDCCDIQTDRCQPIGRAGRTGVVCHVVVTFHVMPFGMSRGSSPSHANRSSQFSLGEIRFVSYKYSPARALPATGFRIFP